MSQNYNYPIQYIQPAALNDGTLIQLRPIHPTDGEQANEIRSKLSDQSLYNRFLGYIPKVTPKLIQQLTQIDYTKEMAIVAELPSSKEIIAVARIAADNQKETEFAVIIADKWHGKGLGSILTDLMINISKEMNFTKIYGSVFSHNIPMLEILKHRNFILSNYDNTTTYAELSLDTSS